MHEELDYSLLGRHPVLPDFLSGTGTNSPVNIEYVWPSGQRLFTVGINDSLTMAFREPKESDMWGVDATAYTTKGTFNIRYDWKGQLERIRVSLADMIIFSSMNANMAESERVSAIERRNYYDAYVTVFPKIHVTRVQQHGSSYDMDIMKYDDGIRTSIVMLPEFPDVMLNVSYDSFFAIQPYFLLEKKPVVTYISMTVDIPNDLYSRDHERILTGIGAHILGVPPDLYDTLSGV